MNTTKQKALDHYDRMIAWAEKQPKNDFRPLMHIMKNSLGEDYGGLDCPYCRENYNAGCKCKLYTIKTDRHHCCAGLWQKMCNAKTWKTWIKRAKKVREYIKDNG